MTRDDFQKLADLGVDIDGALERFLSQTDLYLEYLFRFAKNKDMKILEHSVAAEDWVTVLNSAHALKGITGNLGLTPLFSRVNLIVEKCRAGDLVGISDIYESLQKKYVPIRLAIEDLRG